MITVVPIISMRFAPRDQPRAAQPKLIVAVPFNAVPEASDVNIPNATTLVVLFIEVIWLN